MKLFYSKHEIYYEYDFGTLYFFLNVNFTRYMF